MFSLSELKILPQMNRLNMFLERYLYRGKFDIYNESIR